MQLNDEQNAAYNMIVTQRRNTFLTGKAGTGKSEVVIKVHRYFRSRRMVCRVTAMTASAARRIRGKTLHSLLGLNSQDYWDPMQVASAIKASRKEELVRKLKVLIVDEVQMMSDELFKSLSIGLGMVRKDPAPFGGILLVVTGDLMQLPPVVKRTDDRIRSTYNREGHYPINSSEWRRAGLDVGTVVLTKVMRTRDPLFMKILSQVRKGKLSKEYREEVERIVTRRDPIEYAKE